MTNAPTVPTPVASVSTAANTAGQLVHDVSIVVADTKAIVKHPNTWVANLTTAAAAIVAGIALFHPGFQEPVQVQTALSSVAAIGAIGTQIAHLVSRRAAQTALKVAGK